MDFFYSEKKEECGVIAIYSKKGEDVAPFLYNALVALQHRGQDAAGMVILAPPSPASGTQHPVPGDIHNPKPGTRNTEPGAGNRELVARRGLGLVTDIFGDADMKAKGHIGIGHTRYPTTGRCLMQDVQPSVIGDIALAHNGHLANYDAVRASLEKSGYSFTGTVDSEPIAFLLHSRLKGGATIEEAVRHAIAALDGSYSDVAIIGGRLAAFRDPHAIRPLVWGENDRFISFASESCALDANGIPCMGSVEGGELVVLGSAMERKTILKKDTKNCMFEYVYFSRPDSVINGKEVLETRKKLGAQLAIEHPAQADIVVPVPDTSRPAAEAYARALGLPCEEGLIKNRYIGRTFIMPTQEKRASNVRLKLNPVRSVVSGKRIALIDDSIVRGTTLKKIVSLLREAGASQVHVRITSPPIRHPCFYGVDMKSYGELAAHGKSVREIAAFLGADSLGYLSMEGLKGAIGLPLCTACLDGSYATPAALASALKNR
ncbi:MAG: amidophosphoribosyltransferase [Candidatus Micrarchaeota archaeon]